jgi:hypothetical protein
MSAPRKRVDRPPVNCPKGPNDNVKMNLNHHHNSREATAPRVLLAESSRWSVVALLAVRLAQAGMNISAICPSHHSLRKTRSVRQTFPYSALRPLESIRAAIEATNPDLIIPCDDRAVEHLHELRTWARSAGRSGNKVAVLIEKSLGPPESDPIVSSRYDLLRIARQEGIRVPETEQIKSESDLKSWEERHAFPWLLKADGTGNGLGVRFVRSAEQSGRFLLELTRFYRLGRAIKRLCVNRDPFWLRPWWKGVHPAVIAQSYIHGRPANCGVVCWKGKVLAGIGVEVVSETQAMAHSSIVRVVENSDMMLAAERIAGRLNLSGYFGMDFMIEEVSGLTYLIEMNPRPTRLSALRLGNGGDQPGALYAQLSGQPLREAPPVTQNKMIAYYPEVADHSGKLPESCDHDMPEGEPELVEELRRPWPPRGILWLLVTQVDRMKMFQRGSDFKVDQTSKYDRALQDDGKL